MLGIDIYRYQTVTDWAAVKRHGVGFVYVKGTDGGGPAQQRADGQVAGAKSVGLPVGLYHYAQLTPSPETQARVLAAEVARLDARGMPPALDLELPHTPGPAARAFTRRFLLELRQLGHPVVMLYANTSMLAGISADSLAVPGLRIWAANYGPNNGRRNPLSYRGRVDIHQYTSVGRVPGILGDVDLNESLTTTGDTTMSVEDVVQSWYGPRFRADRNFAQVIHNIEDLGNIANAKIDGLAKAVAALAADPDLDHAAVRQFIVEAMAAAAPSIAAAAAREITEELRPELLDLLGSDNLDQADAFLTKLGERLSGVTAQPVTEGQADHG